MFETVPCRGSLAGRAAGGRRGRLAALAAVLLATGWLAGCEGMSSGQQGAAAGAALGSGIAMVAGGGVAATVGAGLIGGSVGYLGGSAAGR